MNIQKVVLKFIRVTGYILITTSLFLIFFFDYLPVDFISSFLHPIEGKKSDYYKIVPSKPSLFLNNTFFIFLGILGFILLILSKYKHNR